MLATCKNETAKDSGIFCSKIQIQIQVKLQIWENLISSH